MHFFDNSYILDILEPPECEWCGENFQGDSTYCPRCIEALKKCKRCGQQYDTGEPYCASCTGRPWRKLLARFSLPKQIQFVQLQWWLARRMPRIAAWGWVEACMTRGGAGPPQETTPEAIRAYQGELHRQRIAVARPVLEEM
jgi:hypothetical protein